MVIIIVYNFINNKRLQSLISFGLVWPARLCQFDVLYNYCYYAINDNLIICNYHIQITLMNNNYNYNKYNGENCVRE